MRFNDELALDALRRTGDGYLVVNARTARGGNVQLYSGAELGRPAMPTVRVYRPEDEVFGKDAMASFAHRPVTLGHPQNAVTADNWRSLAKGWSAGEVARDGEFVRVDMLLADAEIIQAVEQGVNQLSMGYDCDLLWEGGVSPRGETYDAKQVRIRANHIAVVPAARGGAQLRIGDAAPTPATPSRKELHMMTDAEIRTMRDSVKRMTVTDAAALPIYDNVRGMSMTGSLPAAEYYALLDGARPAGITPTLDVIDRAASQLLYERRISDSWKAPGAQSMSAAPMRDASDNGQTAYEKRISDTWRNQ